MGRKDSGPGRFVEVQSVGIFAEKLVDLRARAEPVNSLRCRGGGVSLTTVFHTQLRSIPGGVIS